MYDQLGSATLSEAMRFQNRLFNDEQLHLLNGIQVFQNIPSSFIYFSNSSIHKSSQALSLGCNGKVHKSLRTGQEGFSEIYVSKCRPILVEAKSNFATLDA